MAKAKNVAISVVPANQASCADLAAVFGERGYAADCQCQFFKTRGRDWDDRVGGHATRADALRQQTHCGQPGSRQTSGLVAYLDGEPVGWCAVEPRTAYIRLQKKPLVWKDRREDKDDDSVWSIVCMTTRVGFRKRGVTYALAKAAVEHARQHGARAIEGYAMIVAPGEDVTWGQLYVGHRKVFAAAGFKEVSRPSKKRVVMRVDF